MGMGLANDIRLDMMKSNVTIDQIDSYYKDYVESGNEQSLNCFIGAMTKFALEKVKRILTAGGCKDNENLRDVLQNGAYFAYKAIKADRENCYIRDNTVWYFNKIYINQAYSFIRKDVEYKTKYNPVSVDEALQAEIPVDILPPTESVEVTYGKEEFRRLFQVIFTIYSRELTLDYKIPQRNFALFYSTILYQIECINAPNLSSSKWAIERMADNTVARLADESGKKFVEHVDKDITWSKEFIEALEHPCAELDTTEPLRDIVYTEAFSKKRIDDLSENMQKVLYRRVNKILKANPALLRQVAEYIDGTIKLRRKFG